MDEIAAFCDPQQYESLRPNCDLDVYEGLTEVGYGAACKF